MQHAPEMVCMKPRRKACKPPGRGLRFRVGVPGFTLFLLSTTVSFKVYSLIDGVLGFQGSGSLYGRM